MTTIREWKAVHDLAKRTLENERRVELYAESSLRRTGFDALDNVICEFRSGTLTLRGRVRTNTDNRNSAHLLRRRHTLTMADVGQRDTSPIFSIVSDD